MSGASAALAFGARFGLAGLAHERFGLREADALARATRAAEMERVPARVVLGLVAPGTEPAAAFFEARDVDVREPHRNRLTYSRAAERSARAADWQRPTMNAMMR